MAGVSLMNEGGIIKGQPLSEEAMGFVVKSFLGVQLVKEIADIGGVIVCFSRRCVKILTCTDETNALLCIPLERT